MSIDLEYSNSLRLCHICKWENFDGYGFNLHAEKGKPGQFIGKVDESSPAEAAGLKEGDRIIEVNGVNISNENHKQVVQRIKACPEETKLLVVDAEGDNYFRGKNIVLKGSLPYAVYLKTPSSPSESAKEIISAEDSHSQKSEKSTQSSENEKLPPMQTHIDSTDNISNNSSTEKNNQNNSLNLNMTAKELRAQLAARKKYDPKKDYTIDFKQKYDIVQKL